MFCIIFADHPHGSCKRTFLKPGLRVEKSKNAALAFSCGQRIRILSETMMPSPRPSTSSLRPLNPATSHNNNNNNGGLHACVCVSCILLSLYRSTQTGSAFLAVAIFIFFLLCLVLLSTVCLFTAQAFCTCSFSSSPFLVNFKRHLEAWNMNCSVLSHFQWNRKDANILETMPRKTEKKKHRSGTCGQGLRPPLL